MDKKERVGEMAKIIKPLMPNQCGFVEEMGCVFGDDIDCPECVIAQRLVEVGYKKESEVAGKILGEIRKAVFDYLNVKNEQQADNLSLIDSTLTYDVVTEKISEIAKRLKCEVKE